MFQSVLAFTVLYLRVTVQTHDVLDGMSLSKCCKPSYGSGSCTAPLMREAHSQIIICAVFSLTVLLANHTGIQYVSTLSIGHLCKDSSSSLSRALFFRTLKTKTLLCLNQHSGVCFQVRSSSKCRPINVKLETLSTLSPFIYIG